MSSVQLSNGASLWYRKLGRGAPLLQLHGSAFGHRNFEKLTPLMESHFEVIDFDLPGYGESHGGPPMRDFPGLAEQVFLLIGALGYDQIHLHGTSFGAMIALTLAAHHPEVVDRLVLSCFLARYDAAARMMRGTWKRAARESGMEAVADLTSVAGFARSFYERAGAAAQLASMREAFSRTTPEAFCAGTEMIEGSDLSPFVQKVRAPTLLLAGAEDHMTPFNPAASGVGFEQIRGRHPGCEVAVLPECGHYLVIEQPERAAELIVEFLHRDGDGRSQSRAPAGR
jgi:pimeloyl-ACP methyl ester carboxylesterase